MPINLSVFEAKKKVHFVDTLQRLIKSLEELNRIDDIPPPCPTSVFPSESPAIYPSIYNFCLKLAILIHSSRILKRFIILSEIFIAYRLFYTLVKSMNRQLKIWFN